MLHTVELDIANANTVETSDIDAFLADAAWTIHLTYHTVLKVSPGAAIFGRDMLFDIPFLLVGNLALNLRTDAVQEYLSQVRTEFS